jgi:hypothetical protein
MWVATAWDDEHARGWTVMDRLRERQERLHNQAETARRRLANPHGIYDLVVVAPDVRAYEDRIRAQWRGGPTVLAFLFAHPDSDVIRSLDARGDYFDKRTGDTWDLFFPGYYRSQKGGDFEGQAGSHPVGRSFADDWYFNAGDFNTLREHVERSSHGRWRYSGGADLVLVNGWMPDTGEPIIDWHSTLSGELTDRDAGTSTLALSGLVERITRDLELAIEDPNYGVAAVVDAPAAERASLIRDLTVNALGGIAAALGARGLGI